MGRWRWRRSVGHLSALAATQTIDNFTCILTLCSQQTHLCESFVFFCYFWWLQFTRFDLFLIPNARIAAHIIYEAKVGVESMEIATNKKRRRERERAFHWIVWCLSVRWSNKCFENHLIRVWHKRPRCLCVYEPGSADLKFWEKRLGCILLNEKNIYGWEWIMRHRWALGNVWCAKISPFGMKAYIFSVVLSMATTTTATVTTVHLAKRIKSTYLETKEDAKMIESCVRVCVCTTKVRRERRLRSANRVQKS